MSRSTSAKTKSENALVHYLKETRAEVAKVKWPTREEGLRLTWVVIVVTAISAVVLFGVDTVFSLVIALIVQST